MITAAKYRLGDEEITIREAAERLGTSDQTVRNRLKIHGNDMEAVFRASEKNGGVKMGEKEERAVEELTKLLCGKEDPAEEPAVEENPESETVALPAICNDDAAAERQVLAMYNKAIAAIDELLGANVLEYDGLESNLKSALAALKEIRRRDFDRLVDWEKIARG